ncbi:hypothetical protein [Oceanobacillus damuensis]
MMCREEEKIPYEVGEEFDLMDGGDQLLYQDLAVKNVEERCIQSIIKEYMDRNTNYRMFSSLER